MIVVAVLGRHDFWLGSVKLPTGITAECENARASHAHTVTHFSSELGLRQNDHRRQNDSDHTKRTDIYDFGYY